MVLSSFHAPLKRTGIALTQSNGRSYSKAKVFFQSFFMLTTVQFLFFA